jgi:hypothetical protein
MNEGDAYTPTAEQHRERAMLLRRQAEYMSPEGRRRLIDIADEFEQLADGIEREGFGKG